MGGMSRATAGVALVGASLCLGGLLAGCAGWSVKTDVDPGVGLARYRTYSWMALATARGASLEHSLASRRVREQADRELAQRGLRRVAPGERPGFLVSATVLERDRLQSEVHA